MAQRHDLQLEPNAFYAAKALYTHARSVLWRIRSGGRADASGVRILAYHRISPDRDELAVTPQSFREQMEYLSALGYRVVGATEAAAALTSPDAGRTIGLTFDDGYQDVVENALPTLIELGMRATVFLPTGAIDGTHRFAWYERQPPLLEWSTITELDRGPALEFGAHTIGHTNLLVLDDDDAAREIGGSKQALEDHLGHPVTAFCYPSGLYGERELRLVGMSGFQLAVGAEPGVNGPDAERLALRRIGIGPRDRLLDFRAKVGGGHDSAPPLRSTYRAVRFGMPRSASSRS